MTPTHDQIIDALSNQLEVTTSDLRALRLDLHERGLLCPSCNKLGVHFVEPLHCDSCAVREGQP